MISETWEKSDGMHHEGVEKLNQLYGISWLSWMRPAGSLGGGVAVAVRQSFGEASAMGPADGVIVPPGLEISWALVIPTLRPWVRLKLKVQKLRPMLK